MSKLTNLVVKRIDLVDLGANLDRATGDGAHVVLWKRAEGSMADEKTMTDDELLNAALADAEALVSELRGVDGKIEKRGSKISAERLARLKSIRETVDAIVAEVEPPTDVVEKSAEALVDGYLSGDATIMKSVDADPMLALVMKRLAGEAGENKLNREKIAAELDKADTLAMAEVLKSYDGLSIKPETDAPILKRIKAVTTPEDYARVEEILKAANAAAKGVVLAESKDSEAERETLGAAGSALAEIEKRASIRVAKSDKKETLSQAWVKVCEEDIDLYGRYVTEQRARTKGNQ